MPSLDVKRVFMVDDAGEPTIGVPDDIKLANGSRALAGMWPTILSCYSVCIPGLKYLANHLTPVQIIHASMDGQSAKESGMWADACNGRLHETIAALRAACDDGELAERADRIWERLRNVELPEILYSFKTIPLSVNLALERPTISRAREYYRELIDAQPVVAPLQHVIYHTVLQRPLPAGGHPGYWSCQYAASMHRDLPASPERIVSE